MRRAAFFVTKLILVWALCLSLGIGSALAYAEGTVQTPDPTVPTVQNPDDDEEARRLEEERREEEARRLEEERKEEEARRLEEERKEEEARQEEARRQEEAWKEEVSRQEEEALRKEIKALCASADAAMKTPVSRSNKLKQYTYLYVGASRATKLKKSVKDSKTYFMATPGVGSEWFGETRNSKKPCLITIRSYLASRPKGIVIIELGNNDPEHIEVYVYVYKKLIKAYPKARFWFVDALPGDGPLKGGEEKNPARIAFNDRLHAEFPTRCLYGYDYLLRCPDFRTVDGIHYPASVERTLYKYLMKKLGRKIKYKKKKVIDIKG